MRTPPSLEDALPLANGCVEHYNNVRLNSAIGYITPKDTLAGHQQQGSAEVGCLPSSAAFDLRFIHMFVEVEPRGNSRRIAASGPRG